MVNYSIVVPVFNSAASLNELTKRIHLAIQHFNRSFELILVDDGSNDDSWYKLEKLKNTIAVG